jgi:futalosine hydrolase
MKPAHVILVGSAGTYDEERLPIGQAIAGSSVALDGVGTGDGEWFRDVGEMGLLQWPGDADTPSIGTSLDLTAPTSEEALLLTVCAASADPLQVQRRRDRFPEALAEEMEGFGVALACALDGISLSIVRGISNVAGERNRGEWKMAEALKAALETVHGLLGA